MPVPPSMWYIQISRGPTPKLVLDTQMYFPSGDQLGVANSLLGSFETCWGSLPSAFMIQTFSAPSRSDKNEIDLPSGENFGWASNAMPPSTNLACPPSMGSV